METAKRPHVVIVGAGFAGLRAAKALARERVKVTVVDRRNHHLFQPLLYQVATAAVDPSDIATPIRSILHHPNLEVQLADVVAVHAAEKWIELTDGRIDYDFLILAAGAVDAYFGHHGWSEFAPGLKSLEDALEVRKRILLAFEEAEREQDPKLRAAWLTFVLIGGGPTGVEMAGALAEVSRHTLRKDFHHIDPESARIVLVEGSDRILQAYPKSLTDTAQKSLERLGVDVRIGQRVTDIDADGVLVDGTRIEARTVLWSAGVAAAPVGKTLGVPLDKAGRVKVEPDLSVPGHPELFVVGDLASVENEGKPVPGVAPAAMQMGAHAARQVVRSLRGEAREPFSYWDRGTFAVIGRGSAVGIALKRFRLTGFLAWMAWLSIHLFFLIGFRNRLFVLVKWAYSYLTMRRGSRLITGPVDVRRSVPAAALPPGAAAVPVAEARKSAGL